jgi:hypothetical protein
MRDSQYTPSQMQIMCTLGHVHPTKIDFFFRGLLYRPFHDDAANQFPHALNQLVQLNLASPQFIRTGGHDTAEQDSKSLLNKDSVSMPPENQCHPLMIHASDRIRIRHVFGWFGLD